MGRAMRVVAWQAGVATGIGLLLGPLGAVRGWACTDVILNTVPLTVMSARTMDFEEDLRSDLEIVPRGHRVTSPAPGGQQGLRWTGKYGFVGVNALDIDRYVDGLNEKGLSAAALWLPETKYATPTDSASALSIQDVVGWILGNFATVAEVKAALGTVTVWGETSAEIQAVPPLHLAVHDVEGNNLVVEFVGGAVQMQDNPNGVLANSPTFSWQLTNLREYVNLTNVQPSEEWLLPAGQGAGMHGLPGDSTSPSRFVRATLLRRFLVAPTSASEAAQFAFRLMGRVAVVPGETVPHTAPKAPLPFGGDYTQWTAVRDHRNAVYYYTTLGNVSVRAVDLTKANLAEGQPVRTLQMEGDGAVWYQDMSARPK